MAYEPRSAVSGVHRWIRAVLDVPACDVANCSLFYVSKFYIVFDFDLCVITGARDSVAKMSQYPHCVFQYVS